MSYRPASYGTGKRHWRVVRDEYKGGVSEVLNKAGKITYYASFEAAKRAADKLNSGEKP